ncbi:hypothetical protein [Serratia marcescens]|uniref:hypothetical protein n=1 Tax=Serratia marcescens TaxID=615 RepID=UPI001379326A|nr:hypothetical protein [Serratia marcescens]
MEGSESVTAKIEFWRLVKATADANLCELQVLSLQGVDCQKWHLSVVATLSSQVQEQGGYPAYPCCDIAE